MNLTIEYPLSGHVRTYKALTQAQVNCIITSISMMEDISESRGEEPVPVKFIVEE